MAPGLWWNKVSFFGSQPGSNTWDLVCHQRLAGGVQVTSLKWQPSVGGSGMFGPEP